MTLTLTLTKIILQLLKIQKELIKRVAHRYCDSDKVITVAASSYFFVRTVPLSPPACRSCGDTSRRASVLLGRRKLGQIRLGSYENHMVTLRKDMRGG